MSKNRSESSKRIKDEIKQYSGDSELIRKTYRLSVLVLWRIWKQVKGGAGNIKIRNNFKLFKHGLTDDNDIIIKYISTSLKLQFTIKSIQEEFVKRSENLQKWEK